MLSFATVVRNQPNKYTTGSKSSAVAETREETVDYGFYDCNSETDRQDAGNAWDSIKGSNDKPYDCYVGEAPSTRPRAPAQVGVVNDAGHRPEKKEWECKADISGSPNRAAPPQTPPPVYEDSGIKEQSVERFLIVEDRATKYIKCIEVVKGAPARSNVLIIVNGGRTDVSLVAALLCLSDISTGPAGATGVAVQVASRKELVKIKGPVDLIINFDMVSSLKELAERGAALRDDEGCMKTLLLESWDDGKAQKFASQLFRYGLSLPFELERYLV